VKPLATFWEEVLTALVARRKIRNWTAANGYSLGGAFEAQALRGMNEQDRARVSRSLPDESTQDIWIICTRLGGRSHTFVSLQHVALSYSKWPTYRDGRMSRLAFEEALSGTFEYYDNPIPYVISLLKEFDDLTR
jgi:hypothetical protein